MKINHHNYEEYFILYMDNELDAEDRRMVEVFVQQYPELNDELQLLLQYKLEPDTSIIFNDKEELLKIDGEAPVSLANYEEWMVLYHDSELSEAQKRSLELFMISNPALKEEFEQLKKAKLEPETIVFAHKASLYRKEERTKPLPWFRIAAAAVLLIAVGVTAFLIINNNTSTKGSGDGFAKDNIPPVIKTPATKMDEQEIAEVNPGVSNKENKIIEQEGSNPVPVIAPAPANNKKEHIIAVNTPTIITNQKTNNSPEPELQKEEALVIVSKPNDIHTSLNNPNIVNNNHVSNAIASHITPETIQQKKDALTYAVVTTANPEPSNIDDGKNTNRGLFRKIARTFEKRSGIDPTDDNRLLVAGLAIRLK